MTKHNVDSSTWHLEAYCDDTNAFGAKAKGLTCDDVVTLTGESSAKRTSFDVY